MGRHRPDPRGGARILIAVIAIVFAVALLVVGGIALYGALTTSSSKPAPSATATAKSRAATSTKKPLPKVALYLRCNAPECKVVIRVPVSNQVLFSGDLVQGEVRTFDQPKMYLVVADASAVDIVINGRPQAKGRHGERKQYSIVRA